MNEQEEAGFWCRVVEGIDAEVEAASFAEKEVLELLQASFKVLSAPRGRWMRCRLERSTTSSFSSGSFCSLLVHSMNVMLRRVLCS